MSKKQNLDGTNKYKKGLELAGISISESNRGIQDGSRDQQTR